MKKYIKILTKYKKTLIGITIVFIILWVMLGININKQIIDHYNVQTAIQLKKVLVNSTDYNFTNLKEFNKQFDQDIQFKDTCPYLHQINDNQGYILWFKLHSKKYDFWEWYYWASLWGSDYLGIEHTCLLYGDACWLKWDYIFEVVWPEDWEKIKQNFLDTVFSENCEQ